MVTLKDYQLKIVEEGFEKLARHKFLYLAAEMRTGKTLMSLSILSKDFSVKSVLFVTVKKAIPSIHKDYSLLKPNFDLSVVNYESVSVFDSYQFDAVVFDEAHSLGAFPKPSGKTIKCHSIVSNCKDPYVIFLSGTPSIESSSQLFHQLYMVPSHPFKAYKNFYKWFEDFGIPQLKRIGGGMQRPDYSMTKEFVSKYLEPAAISITKKEAGFEHFEPSIEEVYVPMGDFTMEVYNSVEKKGLYIKDDTEIIADSAVKVMSKLSQITGGSVITESGSLFFTSFEKAKKVWEIKQQNESVVVFYKYNGDKEILKSQLGLWTDDPEIWRKDTSIPLLLQVKTGSRGVDLSQADVQVYYSLDFSGEAFVQGLDRQAHMHRNKPYVVKILIATDKGGKPLIDKHIFNTVSSKKDFNSNVYRSLKK